MNEPSVEPDVFYDEPEVDPPVAPPSVGTGAAMLTLVLAGARTEAEIACRALLLAKAIKHPHAPQTTRAMARRMGCSVSEAHRRTMAFSAELDRLTRHFRNG